MKKAGSAQDPDWYKDAIIYELHVKSFFDSTNDGIGDFQGLTQKLGYLQDLGITALWLLPFYPSPLRDDGYDIANYKGIHPSYGSLRDFRHFMRAAHERGIQVITELVINHTSDQHPWFQAARRAPAGSSKRQFYVWSDSNRKYADARIIFTDSEKSNWTWDEVAQAFYWHRFFHHQPDLNFDNSKVRRAIMKVMRFWFDLGVDGMRLDAVPYLIEREGTICENLPETHDILKEIRRELDAQYEQRMLLAEANQWPADVRPYFGDGDECHMAFHFPLMPRIFMAVRQEDRHPITEILRQTPEIPAGCQWALFLRNHDELTLEMVTDEERDYLYEAYGADPQMRLNVGIRRRLAPLMENNRQRIELLNSLLLSLPGTPVLYYGDELGMGDNIYLGDRNGVRTPMQWTGDRNAGFSRADPARLYAPPIMDPVYGYQSINVEAQERSPFSLLNWMKRLIALRKQHKTLSRGSIEFLHPQNRKVLVYIRAYEDEHILAVANLARTVQPVELDLSRFAGFTPVEMLGRTEFPRVGELPYFLTLGPYSFYWFRLERAPSTITARVATPLLETVAEPAPLMAGPSWEGVLDGSLKQLVERDLLPHFLRRQRWFAGKARDIVSTAIADWAALTRNPEPTFLALVDVRYADAGTERYMVPIALRTGPEVEELVKRSPHLLMGRLTGARKGVLIDGMQDDRTCLLLLEAIGDQRALATRLGTLRAQPTPAYSEIAGQLDQPVRIRRGSTEQSNTNVMFGEQFILKLFRKLEPGPNPDFEIARHLSERVGFTRVPRLAGGIEYSGGAAETTSVAMLQNLVPSQGNGWDRAIEDLGRYFERTEGNEAPADPLDSSPAALLELALRKEMPAVALDAIGGYVETARKLGRRTAELHLALERDAGDPRFRPEPITADDLAHLVGDFESEATRALDGLEKMIDRIPADAHDKALLVLNGADRLFERFRAVRALHAPVAKTRVHGDYHLGQLLWTEGDFVILDFEGEPNRPLAERLAKQSPLKDVAGMLRSLGYAAYVSLYAHTVHRPDLFDRQLPWARFWQIHTSALFLHAYLETAHEASFLPDGRDALTTMLGAFILDKALYELRYELGNRPDWVQIPLWGILPFLETPPR